MKQISRLIYYLRVKAAVTQAKRLHKLTKKQYFVLQIHKKIRVYDRRQIKYLVDAGVLAKSMREYHTLLKYCLFVTI